MHQDDYSGHDGDEAGPETPYARPRESLSSIQASGVFTSHTPKEVLFIESTPSHRLFEDLLTTYYLPFEVWYMRTIIDKVSSLNLLFVIPLKYMLSAGPSTVSTRYITVSCDDNHT